MERERNSQLKGENMKDVRRFMRYVLPGLASVVMLLIALFISDSSNDLPPIKVPLFELDF
jgi:hypothetical protein